MAPSVAPPQSPMSKSRSGPSTAENRLWSRRPIADDYESAGKFAPDPTARPCALIMASVVLATGGGCVLIRGLRVTCPSPLVVGPATLNAHRDRHRGHSRIHCAGPHRRSTRVASIPQMAHIGALKGTEISFRRWLHPAHSPQWQELICKLGAPKPVRRWLARSNEEIALKQRYLIGGRPLGCQANSKQLIPPLIAHD